MKIIKPFFTIVVPVFLGAIGSGLWEKVFSPAIDAGYRLTVSFVSSMNFSSISLILTD